MKHQYQIVHSCIRVLNLEKSIKFYQETLGFEVARKRDFPEDKFTLVFLKDKKGDFELELTYNYDRQEPYLIGDGYSHLAVVVADLEGSYQKHKEMGLKMGKMKKISKDSRGIYFIADPDGYEIEIIEQ